MDKKGGIRRGEVDKTEGAPKRTTMLVIAEDSDQKERQLKSLSHLPGTLTGIESSSTKWVIVKTGLSNGSLPRWSLTNYWGCTPHLILKASQQGRYSYSRSFIEGNPMPKPLTVWITINFGKFWKRWEYQTTWSASWETYMQVRKQQLELDMEQHTSSK